MNYKGEVSTLKTWPEVFLRGGCVRLQIVQLLVHTICSFLAKCARTFVRFCCKPLNISSPRRKTRRSFSTNLNQTQKKRHAPSSANSSGQCRDALQADVRNLAAPAGQVQATQQTYCADSTDFIDTQRKLRPQKRTTKACMARVERTGWSLFYCHLWRGRSFSEWKATWELFCGNSSASDNMIHRQKSTERIMETWFEMTEDKRLEDITPPLAKLFQSTVELLAEAFLIRRNLTLAGSVSTATLTLALSLEKKSATIRGLSIFSRTSRKDYRQRIETLRAVEDPYRTNLNGDRFTPSARNATDKNKTGPNN
jgi:hypothetical protein